MAHANTSHDGHAPADRGSDLARQYNDGYNKGYAAALRHLNDSTVVANAIASTFEGTNSYRHTTGYQHVHDETYEHLHEGGRIFHIHWRAIDAGEHPNGKLAFNHVADGDTKPDCRCPVTCFSYTNTKLHSNRYCGCAAHSESDRVAEPSTGTGPRGQS